MYFFSKNLHHYAKLSVHLHSKCQTADEAIWAEPRYAMANNVFIYIYTLHEAIWAEPRHAMAKKKV